MPPLTTIEFPFNPAQNPVITAPDGLPPLYNDATDAGGRYPDFVCKVGYLTDHGWLQLPVATDPTETTPRPGCVLVRAFASMTKKTVTYFATRKGDRPIIPAPDTTDSNLRLMTEAEEFNVPVYDASGALHVWAVVVTYVYAVIKPIYAQTDLAGVNSSFPVGAAPFMTDRPAANDFGPAQFSTGILSQTPTGSTIIPKKL